MKQKCKKKFKDESQETRTLVKRNVSGQNDQTSSSAVKFSNKRAKTSYSRDNVKNTEFPQALPGGTSLHFEKVANSTNIDVFDNDYHEPFRERLPSSDTPLAAFHPVMLSRCNSSKTMSSNLKADDSKFQESKPLDMDDGVNDSHSSQLDIASSANEEVKISLICGTSGNSYYQSRILDAVLGQVEDEYCKTYGIKDSDFSLRKLMKKVCRCFLERSTNSRNETITHTPNSSGGKNVVESDYRDNSTNERKIELSKDPQSSNSPRMEAILQKKYPIYINDVTRGNERVQIPLVNDGGALELPNFLYIKNNMVHKDAHVDFSLARISGDNCCAHCHGDCLSSALPCACAGETRGEFAYTQEGLLKEKFLDECIAMIREPNRKYYYYCEICPLQNDLLQKSRRKKPCKGHLTRKFIKECWSICGCNKKCGNRVVQRGIQVGLQVFAAAEGKGWGLRSVQALKKGTFVCEYVGEIVTNLELYERNQQRTGKNEKHTYPVLLDADWGSERILKDEEALCLDATEFGNVGRFVNHRCDDANLIEIPVEVETADHHYYHLAFFTSRDIEPMEELTWDYGIEFGDKYHPVKAFKCKCGSTHCRDKKKL